MVHFRVVSLRVDERSGQSGKAVAVNRGHKARASARKNLSFRMSIYIGRYAACPEALLNYRANVFPVRSSRRYLHSTIAQSDIIVRVFPGEAKEKNAMPIW